MHVPSATLRPPGAIPARQLRSRWRNLEFALLGMVATTLALYAAIRLNLKTPYTAALTAWVVANTRPGHVLSKGFYRICGTLLGACFSVVLVATTNSMPVLLFTGLALWVGCFTAIGNLLRRYRSYFGFLAGYTAAFIALGAYHHPDQILQVALDRTASIIIGVLSMSLVSAFAGYRAAPGEVEETLGRLHAHALAILSHLPAGSSREWSAERLRLTGEYLNAEDQIEYANLEAPGFHHRVRRLRAISLFLLDLVEACEIAHRQTESADEAVRKLAAEIAEALNPASDILDDRRFAMIRARLATLLDEPRTTPGLYPITQVLEEWLPRLDPAKLDREPLRFPLHVDVRGACRHGLRTALALFAAIGFWALTGWQDGAGFVLNCAAFCALMAGAGHPGKAVSMLAASAAVAAIAGFFCKFYLLPHANSFPTLILCLAAVLIPIASLSHARNPWLDNIGISGSFLVLALIQPVNHMTYDPAAYLSSAISVVFATLFVIPAFSLILPTRPEKEAARLVRALRRKAIHLLTRPLAPTRHAWRVMAGDLLRQLQRQPLAATTELDAGIQALDAGTQLLQLRQLEPSLKAHPDSHSALAKVLRAAPRTWRNPDHAREAAEFAIQQIHQDGSLSPALRQPVVFRLNEYLQLLTPASHDS